MRRYLLIGLTCAVAAGISAVIYFLRSPAPSPSVQQTNLPKSVAPSEAGSPKPGAVAEPATSAERPVAQKRSPSSTAIQAKFRSTNNYAAFIQQALGRPDEGGRFYAALAYNVCQQVGRASLSAAPPNESVARREAAAKFQVEINKCKGVFDQFGENSINLANRIVDSRLPPDVLLPDGARGILRPAKPEHAKADLDAAIRSSDPYLIATVLSSNLPYLTPIILDNQAQQTSEDIVYRAMAAVECELTSECVSGRAYLGRCALQGDCAVTDQREYLRAGLNPEQAAQYDRVRQQLLAFVVR